MMFLPQLLLLASRLINPQQFDEIYMRQMLTARLLQERASVTLTDSTCAASSKHHAQYLALAQTISHFEEKPVPGVEALYSITERNVDAEICLTYLAHSDYKQVSYEELADTMVKNWLESPSHREVLHNRRLSKIGASVVYNPKDDTYYAVVNFRY